MMKEKFDFNYILDEINKNDEEKYQLMIDRVKKVKIFYQYRPCRENGGNVYDVNNLLNEVIYARTPLYMNDPYDSTIGFCEKLIFEESLEIIVEKVGFPPVIKELIIKIIKLKINNEILSFVSDMNKIRKTFIEKRKNMHQTQISFKKFVKQNMSDVYRLFPNYGEAEFKYLSNIISNFEKDKIGEEALTKILRLNKVIEELKNQIIDFKKEYIEIFNKALSKINISCLSTSGWDNRLMWAHYSNSYEGICIEYDLSEIDNFGGIIYPVFYQDKRPIISLDDLGVKDRVLEIVETEEKRNKRLNKMFLYLLVKNIDWSYEKEWRIIKSVTEEYSASEIYFPYVKSITIGPKTPSIMKDLIVDVCKDKNIVCYDLQLSASDFSMSRKEINKENYVYDIDRAIKYIESMSDKLSFYVNKYSEYSNLFMNNLKNKFFDYDTAINLISKYNEIITMMYYIKNLFCLYNNEDEFIIDAVTVDKFKNFDEGALAFSNVLDLFMKNIDSISKTYNISKEKEKDLIVKISIAKGKEKKYFNKKWAFEM